MNRIFHSLSCILLLLTIGTTGLFAQVPDGFSYQAVARNSTGDPLIDANLLVRIAILSSIDPAIVVWEEEHNVTTNSYGLFTLTVGSSDIKTDGQLGSFAEIDWSAGNYYIRPSVKEGTGLWQVMEPAMIQSVPFSIASKSHSGGKLEVVSVDDNILDEALFEVRRNDGQPVFSVYNNRVEMHVDDVGTKGPKGGFSVGGFDRSKGSQDYLLISPDSIRLYIPETTAIAKGSGSRGGFAVGGFGAAKGPGNLFFNISGNDAADLYDNVSQVLWYPRKEAFLAGNIHIGSPDSVGTNSTAIGFRPIAMGNFSQALGYKAKALASNSTAIGNLAKATGTDSYAFGSSAHAGGYRSFAFGSGTTSPGSYSVALGTGANAAGYTSVSIGYYSQATNTNSVALGNSASSTGINATAIGYLPQANGEKSISIGSHYSYSFSLLPYFNYTGKGPEGSDETKGDFIIWDPIITPLYRTVSFNRANIADGKYSISFGNGNYSLNGGMALGSNNDALGFGSVAIGVSNKANNTNAFAAGYSSLATGFYATAFGNNSYSKAYGSFTIGQYNEIAGDSTKWVETDPLFIVGNGLNADNRNNAMTIYKNGRTIFKGADANIALNDRRTIFSFNPFTGTFSVNSNVYGIRSYVNRANPDVDYYYSGYFYDIGAEGVYNGFYADQRSGGSIDVAEYIYDTKGNTEPADVVVADENAKESVLLSSMPYQASVLGIVSTEPHLTMGIELVIDEATGDPIPGVQAARLALAGRVPCKVTDENGPIKPGDLVTTSSIPGHAMRWSLLDINEAKDFNELKRIMAENERRRNAVIGKALEAHTTGTGTIVVMISLQ